MADTATTNPRGGMPEVGFGKVAAGAGRRLLNRDGSFNVERSGIGFFESLNLYHFLLSTSWPLFLLLLAGIYLGTNLLFALIYLLIGPEGLQGLETQAALPFLAQAFFFSVQTLATIGYGAVHPQGWFANAVVTIESMSGLLEISLMTGLIFARFAVPRARVCFSRVAVLTDYRGALSFQFRVANLRSSQLMEPHVRVVLGRLESNGSQNERRFYSLKLLLDRIIFFPTYWTVTHVIDEKSPLFGIKEEDIHGQEMEFMILFSATDEASSQTVYVRTSYRAGEIVYGAKFAGMFITNDSTSTKVDMSRLSLIEHLSQ